MWKLKSAPDSPASQTATNEPVTPAMDPIHTVTPTHSPSLFVEISKSGETPQVCAAPKKTNTRKQPDGYL